jgi:hypothetical protein
MTAAGTFALDTNTYLTSSAIASTSNLLAGDGAGNAVSSGIAASNVPLLNAANAFSSSGNTSFAGNVGIGTTSPGVSLEIAKLGSSGTITNLLRLKDTTAGGAAGTGASISFQVTGNTADTGAISSFYDGTNYPMTFKSYYSASLQEVMRIVNGNVGIGTTSPSALLSVGSTSQFQVNSSGVMSAAYGSTAANSGGTQEAICLADGTGCPGVTLYNSSGTLQTAAHMVSGNVAASGSGSTLTVTFSGSAVYSTINSYECTANPYGTYTAAINVTYNSGSSVTFSGLSPSLVVDYICVGN